MFKKMPIKNISFENRSANDKNFRKRHLKFSIKYNKRFAEKIELHSHLKLSRKEPYIITSYDRIIGSRDTQQDNFFVSESRAISPFKLTRTLAVVCDGMGGLEAGDRASLTAVSMMKLAVDKLPKKKLDIPHFFSEMIDYIDYEIYHWDDLKSDKGSGTTMVSVLIENRRLYWASVGDSTIFMYQDDKLKKITSDHNYKMYLDKMVSNGTISKHQAEQDPQQNALLSYIGMGGVAFRDINSKPYYLRNGDLLILCTDGITDTLTEAEIAKIIKENIDDIYVCGKKIVAAVEEKNIESQDNATIVMVHYVE